MPFPISESIWLSVADESVEFPRVPPLALCYPSLDYSSSHIPVTAALLTPILAFAFCAFLLNLVVPLFPAPVCPTIDHYSCPDLLENTAKLRHIGEHLSVFDVRLSDRFLLFVLLPQNPRWD